MKNLSPVAEVALLPAEMKEHMGGVEHILGQVEEHIPAQVEESILVEEEAHLLFHMEVAGPPFSY